MQAPKVTVLSPQEERIEKGIQISLTTAEAQQARSRIDKMVRKVRQEKPRIAVDRARLITESFRRTEHLPVVLRWAKALENVLSKIPIYIGESELIVGRAGPPGRYGILYPELRGSWLEKNLESLQDRKEGAFGFTPEDAEIIRKEILPYWKGRTIFEAQFELLPEETRRFAYHPDDPYTPSYVIVDQTTDRTSLQWVLDYEKVMKLGFNGIRKKAEQRLESLDVYDPENRFDKTPFLKAVIIVCRAMVTFAKRHAALAREMVLGCSDPVRQKELLEIAAVCEKVPGEPASSFREAIQAQWFTQVASRFEQFHGGTVGNGRIDQYLYPFYKNDKEKGLLDDDQALELLEHLWFNIAQNVTFRQSGTVAHWEGVPHFEATTIGGQDRNGLDATNELSYLVLQSKKEFPLDFPDLAARIHARTPPKFLHHICELIKEGTGFPKLFNDEEIIPVFLAKGAPLEESRDYCISGCTEPRLINRDIYLTGICQINLGAAVEMTLNDGRLKSRGDARVGAATGDPQNFATFEDVFEAFKKQVDYITRQAFVVNQTADTVRPKLLAAPLQSALHDLCMENCVDVHQGHMKGALVLGAFDLIGFGTAVDSLVAIKKLVYDDKMATMAELMHALDTDFEGNEILEQRCLRAPHYGNNDLYADEVGRQIEEHFRFISHQYTTLYGGKLDTRYVPVTAHVPHGRVVGATPNGRKSGEPLSDGISPSQGADHKGPTASLQSVAYTKQSKYVDGAARLFNLKLSPQTVEGEEGTRRLASLIRTFCDLKLWHLQFNIINAATLKAAQKDPQKYQNLLVRVAGYSAYFVDLSTDLQNEIIKRTEHSF